MRVALVATLLACVTVAVRAAGATGELSASHAALACRDCHDGSATTVADAACVGCHLAAASGELHRGRLVGLRACSECHGEHRGAAFDPRGWESVPTGEAGFDHALAGWPLALLHPTSTCRDCHTRTDARGLRTYLDRDGLRDATGAIDCVACHPSVHDNKWPSSAQCAGCHQPPPGHPFRHLQLAHTAFPLVNGHAIACGNCHVERAANGRLLFRRLDPSCGANLCHQDSLHRGSLGNACTTCHVSGTWDALAFDHAARFPLRGPHAEARCEACHPARDFAAARPTTCIGCHRDDDAHRGRLGTACERCHRDDGAITFDHDRSRFPLTGAHRRVACADCHPSRAFVPRPLTCAGCHPTPPLHAVRHVGARCEGCHTTASFTD